MNWQVIWTAPAVRDMRRLDNSVAKRIRQAIQRLAGSSQGDVQRLRGRDRE